MKYFKFLTSTLSMIILYFVSNVAAYFLFINKYPIITLFLLSIINVNVGIIITYNALVSMNKRTVKKILNT